jgi:hypothetical protein
MARDYKKEAEEKRQAEMEAGRKAVVLFSKLEKLNAGTKRLQAIFPSLLIDTVINKPYDHVTMRVRRRFIAPLESPAVLTDAWFEPDEIELTDPIDGYPTDFLVTKLALIA